MSYIGTKGKITLWDADEPRVVEVEITGTFYEPGDPRMAVNVRELTTGKPHAGLEFQDFIPSKES